MLNGYNTNGYNTKSVWSIIAGGVCGYLLQVVPRPPFATIVGRDLTSRIIIMHQLPSLFSSWACMTASGGCCAPPRAHGIGGPAVGGGKHRLFARRLGRAKGAAFNL